jgi:alanine racemase
MQVINDLEREGSRFLCAMPAIAAATLDLPHMHLDLVRVGTLLYGQFPSLQFSINFPAGSLAAEGPDSLCQRGAGRDKRWLRPDIQYKSSGAGAVLPIGYVDGYTLDPILRPESLWDLA